MASTTKTKATNAKKPVTSYARRSEKCVFVGTHFSREEYTQLKNHVEGVMGFKMADFMRRTLRQAAGLPDRGSFIWDKAAAAE